MLTFGSILLFVLSGAIIRATNTSGDPTDLANWPPCAVGSTVAFKHTFETLIVLQLPKMHPHWTRTSNLMPESF